MLKGKEAQAMKEVMTLQGPVLKVDGQLMLVIPLDAGGSELAECSRGIAEVQGSFLKILIPEWLAGILRIEEGDLVCVSNGEDKFHVEAKGERAVN
jgi:hypothetical protein